MDDAVELGVGQVCEQALEVGGRIGIDDEFVFGDPLVGRAGRDQSAEFFFGAQEGGQA